MQAGDRVFAAGKPARVVTWEAAGRAVIEYDADPGVRYRFRLRENGWAVISRLGEVTP